MFFILIFTCVVLLSYYIYKQTRLTYWKDRNVIEAGNPMWEFIFQRTSIPEVHKKIYDQHKDQPYVGLHLGRRPILFIRDLTNAQAILSSDFQNFFSRGIISNSDDKLSDNILFINDYRRWKIIRQRLSPLFTSARLKKMFYIIEKNARDFVEVMEDNLWLRANAFQAINKYTIASIGASVFGINTKYTTSLESPFLEMTKKALGTSFKSNIRFFIFNTFPQLIKVLGIQTFGEHSDFFLGFMSDVLKKRREDPHRYNDFIDLCKDLQNHGIMQDFQTGYELVPSNDILGAQAFFFFIAGTDTSANTIYYTLLELSNNPDILEKVHKEIDEVFVGKDVVTYDDVEKLNYLDMVISESMRKYPTIALIQRECTKDTQLPVGNLTVEAGTLAVIPVFAIHRDEKYYPNPDVFDPERFAPNQKDQRPNCSYMPFGEGNRSCIGMRFARLQVKAGLAWLLRKFTLEEQNISITFEHNFFALRSTELRIKLIMRDDNLHIY